MTNEPDTPDSRGAKAPAFPGLSDVTHLGAGGMGTVFRAWQKDLERPVAVKTLHTDLAVTSALREQFAREAHILAQLDHPGIVTVHYAGEASGGPYYVMRLVEGVSVVRHLAGASGLEVAEVFRSIAEALAAAHKEGVLHRDVKPANILVESSGRPILVDFGLSTITAPGTKETADGILVGTPDYLAPEILGGGGYSPASDIYALGATLYLVLTGRVPFPAEGINEKLNAIREDDPPTPRALRPEIPKPLQAVCLKAMERSPGDRYASAEELQRDLSRFLEGDPVQALPERSRSLLRRKIQKHLEDHVEWEEQGLLDEQQCSALESAYEALDEHERGLLRGVLTSVPNLLLLAGLLLTVFGPLLLQLMTWEELGSLGRIALPAAPLALLTTVGLGRWRSLDRRRGVACLMGAALLVFPTAFALMDLVPTLRSVVDDAGNLRPILPGILWLPAADAPDWVHSGATLLEWKLLSTSTIVLATVATLYRRTHSAFFLWVLGLAAAGAVLPAAQLAGWRELPLPARWLLTGAGSLAVIASGIPLDRRWRRDRALPFYGLGFIWGLISVLTYASEGLPVELFGPPEGFDTVGCSFLIHGLGITAAGLLAHHRGTSLLRQTAGVPLLASFLFTFVGVSGLSSQDNLLWELALVAAPLGYLLMGLALHRNSLVLVAAVALPLTVGSVSQRHLDALWAWSVTIVLMGAAMVLLAFRLPGHRPRPESEERG